MPMETPMAGDFGKRWRKGDLKVEEKELSKQPSRTDGMEHSIALIPPFQSFVKRNAPPRSPGLWQPISNLRRRSSSVPALSNRSESSLDYHSITRPRSSIQEPTQVQNPPWDYGPSAEEFMASRRSSSVYSRASTMSYPDRLSWQTSDFADPRDVLLRPMAYESGTLQSQRKQRGYPRRLSARSLNPLVPTPSPSPRVRSYSPVSSISNRSALLAPAPKSPELPTGHLRTVSLEKARLIMSSGDTPRLLPEELRAQRLGISRSQEVLRFEPDSFSPAGTTAMLSSPATLKTDEYRVRPDGAIQQPRIESSTAGNGGSGQGRSQTSQALMTIQKSKPKQMLALTNQTREESKAKVVQALGLDDTEEARGRTKVRGPRQRDYSHYMPNTIVADSDDEVDKACSPREDARKIAKQYHAVLIDQYRKPNAASRSNSKGETKKQVRMIPPPLFSNKPLPGIPGSTHTTGESLGSVLCAENLTPSLKQPDGTLDDIVNASLGGSSRVETFTMHRDNPVRPQSDRSHQTSGSITISPPYDFRCDNFEKPSARPAEAPSKQRKRRSNHREQVVSAYYPHVMHRHRKKEVSEKAKARHKKSDSKFSGDGGMLMLEADIIALRNQRPGSQGSVYNEADDLGQASSAGPSGPASAETDGSAESPPSSASPDVGGKKRSFHKRIVDGAARYVDIVGKSQEVKQAHTNQVLSSPVLDDQRRSTPLTSWPRFVPQRTDTQSPRLGWSTEAKRKFDKRDSGNTGSGGVAIQHTVTQARPLCMRQAGLRDDLDQQSRSRKVSGIFDHIVDFRREAKAEKRRNELKKSIQVVQNSPSGNDEHEGMI